MSVRELEEKVSLEVVDVVDTSCAPAGAEWSGPDGWGARPGCGTWWSSPLTGTLTSVSPPASVSTGTNTASICQPATGAPVVRTSLKPPSLPPVSVSTTNRYLSMSTFLHPAHASSTILFSIKVQFFNFSLESLRNYNDYQHFYCKCKIVNIENFKIYKKSYSPQTTFKISLHLRPKNKQVVVVLKLLTSRKTINENNRNEK